MEDRRGTCAVAFAAPIVAPPFLKDSVSIPVIIREK